MEIDIQVGQGPDELVKGKQLLVENLTAAWAMLQKDPSIDPLIITFKFGAARESWFRLGRNENSEPVLSYADKDHLAILFPLKETIGQFLSSHRANQVRPFVLKDYFCDIDEQLRLAKTLSGGSYPEGSPKNRLAETTPQAVIKRQKEQLPPLAFESDPLEKSPGQLSFFAKSDTRPLKPDSQPEISPTIKRPGGK